MKKILLSLLVLFGLMAGAEAQNDIPLTFEAIGAGTVTLEKEGDFTPNSGVQYRLGETGDWSSYSYGTGISLQAGEKLQFRSTSSAAYAIDWAKYSHFTCTADCYLYGSVGALFNNSNSLPDNACSRLFYGNTHIKSHTSNSLVLPATSLAQACYEEMFSGCTALTTPPALPATSLADYCYQSMFYGCTALTAAPELPATSLADFCYNGMFFNCTHLNYVKCLATDISANNCTRNWLLGVASTGTFVKAPGMENWTTGDSGIPAGWTVEDYYHPLTFEAIEAGTVTLEFVEMVEGVFTPNSEVQYRLGETGDWSSYSYGTGISLQAGEKVQFRSTSSAAYAIDPVNYSHFTCTADCYLYGSVSSLFNNSNSLPGNACSRLFYGNTHIKSHTSNSLVLPATSLAHACYEELFSGCTALTTPPALPATSLADHCYNQMFSGCTALTAAPELPATSLASYCYQSMFSGCTALTVAPALPATSLAKDCYRAMFSSCTSLTAAPELPASTLVDECYFWMFDGCTNLNYVKCLATDISAKSCTLHWLRWVASTGTFVKAQGMENWTTGESGIPAGWTVEDYDLPLTFRAVEAGTITVKLDEGSTLNPIQYSVNGSEWSYAPWDAPIDVDANDVVYFRGNNGTCCVYVDVEGIWQPAGFHFECSNPCYVYGNMMSLIDQDGFDTDTTLTEPYAFFQLFYTGEPNTTILNHPSLDIVLPATTLTDNCYNSMFMYCQGITRAPALPATTLAAGCYNSMFSVCTSLATAPILPATALASDCYRYMFSTCDSLTVAPELPATELYNSCYYGMFSNCKNLTTAPSLPATTLANDCYRSMFYGCESLTVAPALPATTLAESCYNRMFYGCKNLTTAPALPATTLVNSCYRQMFSGCSTLKYVVCLATDISASDCLTNWLSSAPNTNKCTFVKASEMTTWPRTTSGIPNKWIVQDINTFTTDGNWNVAANWSHNAVPAADSSVLIAANATIPNGYTANAKCIIVDEGKALTIAEGGQLIHSNPGVVATVQKSISAYHTGDGYTGQGNTDGWHFIASPITGDYTPAGSMITNTYDLYRLNPTSGKWENFKNTTSHPDFTALENGTGYLYANSVQTTLGFTGTLKPYAASETVSVSEGWNLIGNPFAYNVYASCPFYKMNEGKTGIEAVSSYNTTAIAPCTGILVDADASGTVAFSKDAPSQQSTGGNKGSLNIALTQANTRGASTTLDNAIITFSEGEQLGKFYFGEQSANIYIPQDGEEYAIINAETTGEMPLNFKAKENGTYTLTVNPEGVELGYLHLIDNLTGADIDLLHPETLIAGEDPQSLVPSYTFTAKTTDYESRFKLVFSANGEDGPSTGSGTFAFVSNGNIIVNGEGTLQVIDVLGRQRYAKELSTPNCQLSTANFPAGVYMLRLINGEKVMVQKIVVR